MAVYETAVAGKTYKWIEKGARAALVVDGTRLLWMGDPCDPIRLRDLKAPLEVLLLFSRLRLAGID